MLSFNKVEGEPLVLGGTACSRHGRTGYSGTDGPGEAFIPNTNSLGGQTNCRGDRQ